MLLSCCRQSRDQRRGGRLTCGALAFRWRNAGVLAVVTTTVPLRPLCGAALIQIQRRRTLSRAYSTLPPPLLTLGYRARRVTRAHWAMHQHRLN